MRSVGNEVLADLTKRVLVSGRDIDLVLGPSDEVAVTPLRTYGRARYYQYCDGRTEYLAVTREPDAGVYSTMIRPVVRVVDDADGALVVRVTVAAHCALVGATLAFGHPRTSVPAQSSSPAGWVFPIADAPTPQLGSELVVAIEVRVGQDTYSVERALPYAPLARCLTGSPLSALRVDDTIRLYVDSPADTGVARVVDAVRQGTATPPLVEPVASGVPDQGLRVLEHEGVRCAVVDVDGTRYALLPADPAWLDVLEDDAARQVARELSWPSKLVPARAVRAGRTGQALAQARTGLRARAQGVRRRAILGALDLLGYETYHRLQAAAGKARPRNAYWEYVQGWGRTDVQPGTVLHVGFNYQEFSGHLARLAVGFERAHPQWRQVIVVSDPEPARETCRRLGVRAEVVTPSSRRYGRALLTSEVVLTDSTMPRWFTTAPGQRLFNVWHGTPLKSMGRAIGGSPRAMSNTQRNFLQSTAVLVSNDFTQDAFISSYMTPPDNFELWPSPRNTWLFEAGVRERIRRQIGVGPDDLVVLYLPTWRGEGNSMRDVQENVALFESFSRVARRVQRPARFFAKPHRFTRGKVDPSALGFQLPPADCDLYEFLTAVDCLVTDYSSVLFDFLPLNKPIVLDLADLDRYRGDRGLFLDPTALGLAWTRDEDGLVAAIESAPATADHAALIARFAPLDGAHGADAVVGRTVRPSPAPVPRATRERVLLYPGSLWTNGITTSFLNLLHNLDLDAREYWVFLPEQFTSRPGGGVMEAIVDSGIRYLPSPAGFVVRRQEAFAYHKFNARLTLSAGEMSALDTMMLREADRIFPRLHFDHLVNFSGYEAFIAKFLGALTLRGSRLHTWVHNDMLREQELRRNFNVQALMESYRRSSTVDVVSEPVADRLRAGYFPADVLPRVRVVHNTVDSDKVRRMAEADVDYMTPELRRTLDDPSVTKFVNIGRFSPEKDHLRLVEAFDTVSAARPEQQTALFLIGGPGNSRDRLLARVAASPFRERIHVFESINPHPILSRCDLFVLSSHYEGLPMVFFEALSLDVPILSVAIPGPKEFLEQGYGATCPDSTQGLVDGMDSFMAGTLPGPTRTLEEFNQRALGEFSSIFAAAPAPKPPA